jgi:shikimate 5-dehydrogenase
VLVSAGNAIAAAVARRCAKSGCTVCVCRREAAKSEELVDELKAASQDMPAFSVAELKSAEKNSPVLLMLRR